MNDNYKDKKDPVKKEIIMKRRIIADLQERKMRTREQIDRLWQQCHAMDNDIADAQAVIKKLEEEVTDHVSEDVETKRGHYWRLEYAGPGHTLTHWHCLRCGDDVYGSLVHDGLDTCVGKKEN